jgi:hypothetical protein
MRGYLTPQVEQLLDFLNDHCPSFSEQTMETVGKQTVALSQDRENTLQSLYVVGNLLRGFNFNPDDLEAIGSKTFEYLTEIYSQKALPQDEKEVDTRVAGWTILNEVVTKVSPALKTNISQLSSRVGSLDQEDDFIQKQALKLALQLAPKSP